MTDYEWHQSYAEHCPNKECNGMLLQSDYCLENKCHVCGKYFFPNVKFEECSKPKGDE